MHPGKDWNWKNSGVSEEDKSPNHPDPAPILSLYNKHLITFEIVWTFDCILYICCRETLHMEIFLLAFSISLLSFFHLLSPTFQCLSFIHLPPMDPTKSYEGIHLSFFLFGFPGFLSLFFNFYFGCDWECHWILHLLLLISW